MFPEKALPRYISVVLLVYICTPVQNSMYLCANVHIYTPALVIYTHLFLCVLYKYKHQCANIFKHVYIDTHAQAYTRVRTSGLSPKGQIAAGSLYQDAQKEQKS